MDIILNGSEGRMGKAIQKRIEESQESMKLLAAVDLHNGSYHHLEEVSQKGDVIIDFSNHAATKELLDYALKTKTKVVLATTGHTQEEKEMILHASKKIPIFFSYNMSIGIAAVAEAAKRIAATMPDAEIEIVETHHDQKLDAPSGTALLLAQEIQEVRKDSHLVLGRNGHQKRKKNDIGISSIRIGNVVGIHEILISNGLETITLKHEAYDRSLFALGALKAASFLMHVDEPGIYTMKDLVNNHE